MLGGWGTVPRAALTTAGSRLIALSCPARWARARANVPFRQPNLNPAADRDGPTRVPVGDGTTGAAATYTRAITPPPAVQPQGEPEEPESCAPPGSDDLSLVLRQLILLSEACRVRDEGNGVLESSRIRWL